MEDTYVVISKDGFEIEENGSAYFYKHSRKGEIPYPDIENADLALMFRDNYLVAFDNLQTLNAKLSDKLCTIVTGITESRRKLYTDDEMVHFDLCQPIVLNGIHDIVKREDMLSRCIIMNLEKPVGKDAGASEKVALTEEFMSDRPVRVVSETH